MRDIKFRVWFQNDMIYLKPTVGKYDYENGIVLSFSEDGYAEFSAHERFDVGKELPPFMQYTGMKDKNRKEIYEGDIVVWDHLKATSLGEVYWNSNECVYAVRHPDEPVESWLDNKCRIIGNVFENPDLLKR